jgi:hypothetical protein
MKRLISAKYFQISAGVIVALMAISIVPTSWAAEDCTEEQLQFEQSIIEFSDLLAQTEGVSAGGMRQVFPIVKQKEDNLSIYHDLLSACNDSVKEEALSASLTPEDPDLEECPDCVQDPEIIQAIDEQIAAKEEVLFKAQQDLDISLELIDQTKKKFSEDLKNGLISACSLSSNPQVVNITNRLSDTILDSPFDCQGSGGMRNLAEALSNLHTEYDLQLKGLMIAQLKRDNVQKELNPLITEKSNFIKSNTDCIDRFLANKCQEREAPEEADVSDEPEIEAEVEVETKVETEDELIIDDGKALENFSSIVDEAFPKGSKKASFSDLSGVQNEEVKTALVNLGDRGLFLGIGGATLPETQSRPSGANQSLTRAELAQLLYRGGSQLSSYKQLVQPEAPVFDDVELKAWYSHPFAWMAQNGFFKQGRPSATVNNAEAVTAVRRWLGLAAPEMKAGQTWYDGEFGLLIVLDILPLDYAYGIADDPASRGFIALLIDRALELGKINP